MSRSRPLLQMHRAAQSAGSECRRRIRSQYGGKVAAQADAVVQIARPNSSGDPKDFRASDRAESK